MIALLPLLAKMAATATLVVTAARMAERYGPFIGAMVASLPVSAGPSYVFLALDHSNAFIAEAAAATIATNIAGCVFICTYALAAQWRGVVVSLLLAYGAWALAIAALNMLALPVWLTGLGNLLAYGGAMVAMRRFRDVPRRSATPRWWDIPLRAALVMTMVAVVLLLAERIGPHWTGIIAAAPVAMTSMMLILHPRLGGPAAASVVIHMLPGLIGFFFCILTVHLLAVTYGSALALSLALVVALVWNLVLLVRQRRLNAP